MQVPYLTPKQLSIILILFIGLLGILLLIQSSQENRSRASLTNTIEPESGTLTGNVSVETDSNATDGKYIV